MRPRHWTLLLMKRGSSAQATTASRMLGATAVFRAMVLIAALSALGPVACGADDDATGKKAVPGEGGSAGAGGQGNTDGGTAGHLASGGSSGSGGAAGSGQGGDASVDASIEDASLEAETSTSNDGVADAPADVPVSTVCGDAIRDPVTEECDDGTGLTPPDSCSSDCRVQDVLVAPNNWDGGGLSPSQIRRMGLGRHTVAGGDSGFAVVFMDASTPDDAVTLRAFDPNGVPGALIVVANDASVLEQADPVVAALPGGKYAVAYADLNADGNLQGVAMRIVDPATSTVGGLIRVNTPVAGNQREPDIMWTGSEIVVAYYEEIGLATKGDVKVRRFDVNGSPKSGATMLAGTSAAEARVALAPFAGDYAVAWMSFAASTNSVLAQAGGASWSITLPPTTDSASQPAIAELDATHLLVVFVEGGASPTVARLRGAILDTSASEAPAPFDIAPLVEPYASDATLDQVQPALVRVGDRVFVSWKSHALPLTFEASELWLKEITWSASGGTFTLDLSSPEIPLPRAYAHTEGNQSYPALAATTLVPGGALATAWEDNGDVFGNPEAKPDVIAELIPVPIVRFPSEGGLE